jgi:hypothetical protein
MSIPASYVESARIDLPYHTCTIQLATPPSLSPSHHKRCHRLLWSYDASSQCYGSLPSSDYFARPKARCSRVMACEAPYAVQLPRPPINCCSSALLSLFSLGVGAQIVIMTCSLFCDAGGEVVKNNSSRFDRG